MKRIGNIYSKIYSKDNIRNAILCASKGKRNRKSVQIIIENIDKNIDIKQCKEVIRNVNKK